MTTNKCKEIITALRGFSQSRKTVGAGVFALALIVFGVVLFHPVTVDRKHRAAVLVENTSCYRVVCGKDTLYFRMLNDSLGMVGLSFTPEVCLQKDYEVGYFTSLRGDISLPDSAFRAQIAVSQLQEIGATLLGKTLAYQEGRRRLLSAQVQELVYYVRTHMHDDDGFEEMKSLLADTRYRLAEADSLCAVVGRMEQESVALDWGRTLKLTAWYQTEEGRRRYRCEPLDGSRTQLSEKGLPAGAKCILNPFFSLTDLEERVDSFMPDSQSLVGNLRPYVGILKGPDFRYAGEIRARAAHGLGTCILASGVRKEGSWLNGVLNGEAVLSDTSGVTYSGIWAHGHLAGGTALFPNGDLYVGSFLDDEVFDGAGELYGADGSVYLGSWADGLRHGFGMSMTADGKMQCGSWKENEFEGERLLYTADRVYGIDIARYQHLNRRRRPCNISWKYLRITSLGTRSAKRISGKVSYPVSFVYMKATEGATVLNRYFRDDYAQARKLGIPVGAYHFFSSAPAEEQVAWFFKNTRYQKGDLPPVLDLEPTDAYIKKRWGTDEKMFHEVLKWLRAVEARYGVKPLLYVNQMFIKNHLSHASEEVQGYDLWVARYGEFKPYSHLIYWQLSPDGKVSGIQSDVDINVFNGSKDRFTEYVNSFK